MLLGLRIDQAIADQDAVHRRPRQCWIDSTPPQLVADPPDTPPGMQPAQFTGHRATIAEHGPRRVDRADRRAGGDGPTSALPPVHRRAGLHDTIARAAVESFLVTMVPVLIRPNGSARSLITQLARSFVTWMTDNASRYPYVLARGGAVGNGGRRAG